MLPGSECVGVHHPALYQDTDFRFQLVTTKRLATERISECNRGDTVPGISQTVETSGLGSTAFTGFGFSNQIVLYRCCFLAWLECRDMKGTDLPPQALWLTF